MIIYFFIKGFGIFHLQESINRQYFTKEKNGIRKNDRILQYYILCWF